MFSILSSISLNCPASIHLWSNYILFIPPRARGVTRSVCSGTTSLLDHVCSLHRVCRAGVTSRVSRAASSFLPCLLPPPLILFHSLPSPHNSLFLHAPTCYLSHLSHLLLLLHSPPFLLIFFFFYCSYSHTPTCCSKSLKGTELVGALGTGLARLLTEGLHQPCRQT